MLNATPITVRLEASQNGQYDAMDANEAGELLAELQATLDIVDSLHYNKSVFSHKTTSLAGCGDNKTVVVRSSPALESVLINLT